MRKHKFACPFRNDLCSRISACLHYVRLTTSQRTMAGQTGLSCSAHMSIAHTKPYTWAIQLLSKSRLHSPVSPRVSVNFAHTAHLSLSLSLFEQTVTTCLLTGQRCREGLLSTSNLLQPPCHHLVPILSDMAFCDHLIELSILLQQTISIVLSIEEIRYSPSKINNYFEVALNSNYWELIFLLQLCHYFFVGDSKESASLFIGSGLGQFNNRTKARHRWIDLQNEQSLAQTAFSLYWPDSVCPCLLLLLPFSRLEGDYHWAEWRRLPSCESRIWLH